MQQTYKLQAVIESVEALSEEEQDMLFDLIHKRRIAHRRQQIAQRARDITEAIQNGTAKIGTVDELVADLFGDEE
ncbi:MAG: hypothetical protein IGS50_15045 [Synechococcales cyanobacterium C42_A2020_086]|jgi:hypothetical protein|nr:hypothetical protein [Synechococcales cyanobacterium C42_A2020_086]